MPFIQLDLPGEYPSDTKKRLARKLGDTYCEIMQARQGIVNVAFRELGKGNIFRTGQIEPCSVCVIACDIRKGRNSEQRRKLAEALVQLCTAELGLPEGGYTVNFTQHPGNEIFRDGRYSRNWYAGESGDY